MKLHHLEVVLSCLRRFRLALYDMIGYYPSYFFVGCWAVVTPAICAGIFFFKVSPETSLAWPGLD